MIEKGADVMYAERFGVSDAAKERGKLAIGNVIDTQSQYPDTVVASALWNMEPTIDRAIKNVKAGTFKAEDYGQYSTDEVQGLGAGAARHVRRARCRPDLMTKVKAKEKAILDGKFKCRSSRRSPSRRRSDVAAKAARMT